jgi:hypothetical protein
MPLAATDKLTPNFTAGELGVHHADATVDVVANARKTATWLQAARGVIGVPLIVTSGFRPPAVNTAVGGASDSDHLTGLAADFEAQGLSAFTVYQRLLKAQEERKLPAFDQLIFYALDNHIHVGVGPRMRGQVLLKTAEGSYVQLAGSFVSKIRGYL